MYQRLCEEHPPRGKTWAFGWQGIHDPSEEGGNPPFRPSLGRALVRFPAAIAERPDRTSGHLGRLRAFRVGGATAQHVCPPFVGANPPV